MVSSLKYFSKNIWMHKTKFMMYFTIVHIELCPVQHIHHNGQPTFLNQMFFWLYNYKELWEIKFL